MRKSIIAAIVCAAALAACVSGCAAAAEAPETLEKPQATESSGEISPEAGQAEAGQTETAQTETPQAETVQTETPQPPEAEAQPAGTDAMSIPYIDFTAYRQSGDKFTLSDHIGTPMVINFWATWCGPCRSEMAHFATLEDETEGAEFYMVNLTDGVSETEEAVEEYLSDEGLEFDNVLLDKDAGAQAAYGIYSIPLTIFIDAEGSITGGRLGAMDESELRERVASLTERQTQK